MLLGAHVSIAGGIDQAIDRGTQIGATAIQTFASSPRSINGIKPPDQQIIEAYIAKRNHSAITYHVFHGVYLINLAHEDPNYVQVCTQVLTMYQQLAARLNVAGTCFHIGSHKGTGLESKLTQIAEAIALVLREMPVGVDLMLENAAGQKGTIGVSFEELVKVMDAVDKTGVDTTRLTVALDTQHAYASGYAIDTNAGLESMLEKIEALIGLQKVTLIHLNDSAVPYASYKDRHANIGQGYLGAAGIAKIINHPLLTHKPFILEVPGKEKQGASFDDLNYVRSKIDTI